MSGRKPSDANRSQRELQQRIQSGTRAVIVVQVASQIVSLFVLGWLFRLVDKPSFGLMGMVIPVIMLPRMVTTYGLSVAAIQQKEISQQQQSNLFWFNLGLGTVASLVSALLGPLFASLYDAPEITIVCYALSATSLVTALGAQHQARLERELMIWRLSLLRLIAQIIGGVFSVAAALKGWGVWALVVQQYAELGCLSFLVIVATRWRPSLPRRSEMNGLVRFGGHYSLSMLLFYLVINVDKVVLSWMLGGSEQGRVVIGYYYQAFQLMMRPVYLVTTPITGIMLPSLSRAKTDPAHFRSLTFDFYRMTAIALLPCSFGLAVVSKDLMTLMGGPGWSDAGAILLALTPVILVKGKINIAGSVFSALGRADQLCFGAFVQTVLLTQAAFAAMFAARQVGADELTSAFYMATSYSLTTVLVVAIPYLAFCFRIAQLSLFSVLKSWYRPFVSSSAMGAVAWAANRMFIAFEVHSAIRLVLVVGVGVLVYSLLSRRELAWLKKQLIKRDQSTNEPV